ncbi:replication initiator protein A (plasmid) [Acinetobacter baumannii]
MTDSKPPTKRGGGKPGRKAALDPVRHVQGDLFVADILDVMPKGDAASMEHPVFALRPGDKKIRKYEHNGNTLEVIPSALGLATMHDKDVLLYCIGQLVEAINRGRVPSRTVRITAHDLLHVTNRGTGKSDYERLRAALTRLRGTTLRTNIKTADRRIDDIFGLIEDAQIVREEKGRMIHIDITLSQWTYNAAVALEVLTYNRDYFRLRGGLERRLYELARKHTGTQARWTISLELLQKKAGAGGPLWSFRQDMKQLAHSDHLPDYRIHYEPDSDMVSFYHRGEAGHRKQLADLIKSVTGSIKKP